MPGGVSEPGHSRNQYSKDAEECELYAFGIGEVILSKTSLSAGHDYVDPSVLVDFFGGAVSSACVRSRISASFFGEPGTPNGAGDNSISFSPASSLPAGKGHCYAQPSVGVRAENDGSNLARRSCSFENDEPFTSPVGYSVPLSAPRGSRFHSSVGYGGPGPASALSATSVPGMSVEAKPISTNSHTEWLEQQLRDQCAENQLLRRQLQERDAQLSALRAEVHRLQADQDHVHCPMSPAPLAARQANHGVEEELPGLLAQLQRARNILDRQQPPPSLLPPTPALLAGAIAVSIGGALAMDGAPASPAACTTSALPPPSPASPAHTAVKAVQEASLMRLDTPPHAHEPLPPLRSLSDDLGTEPARVALLPSPSPHAHHVTAEGNGLPPASAAESVPRTSGVATDAATQTVGEVPVSAADGLVLPSLDSASVALRLHPLVAAERRRTDRAHAALLFSSRQASRLASRLAEVEVRAELLSEELRDWRRACLGNHRQLVLHRRAAAAAAAGELCG